MSNLDIIKDQLLRIVDNIDAGNTNMSEDDGINIMRGLAEFTNPKTLISKYQAVQRFGKSRATFDRYVKAGKIPKGIHQQGVIGLFWYKEDIDKAKELYCKEDSSK